jgi:hypothetical protein
LNSKYDSLMTKNDFVLGALYLYNSLLKPH